jgi:hypothetical protein
MSELPDSELLRVQEQLRLKAGQEQSDPEYFENMANRIGKILKVKETGSEVPTYSVPGMARSLNYEGKHITQAMNRFEDAPIGFRVLLSCISVENYDKRYNDFLTTYHLLVKESEKHWIRVDENNQEKKVAWDAEFPISMVEFENAISFENAFENATSVPQDSPKIASTWAISGKNE